MLIPSATIGLATPVAAGATATSSIINTQGLMAGAVGLVSDHVGTLKVQRYVDANGTIPLGPAFTVAVGAGGSSALGWADGLPNGSFIITFINALGAIANLSNITALLSGGPTGGVNWTTSTQLTGQLAFNAANQSELIPLMFGWA